MFEWHPVDKFCNSTFGYGWETKLTTKETSSAVQTDQTNWHYNPYVNFKGSAVIPELEFPVNLWYIITHNGVDKYTEIDAKYIQQKAVHVMLEILPALSIIALLCSLSAQFGNITFDYYYFEHPALFDYEKFN